MSYVSTLAAKQAEGSTEKTMPTEWGGRVRVAVGSFTPTETVAAGSTIELAKLPEGCRVLPASKIFIEAGQGPTLTLAVGDVDDSTRYLAATVVGASATSIALEANALNDTLIGEDGYVYLTTGVVALTTGKKIGFEIFYVID